MFFEQRLIGMMANYGYLIGDPEAKVAAVIDPSFDARVFQKVAQENGYTIATIFNTHHHPDHVFDNERLADEASAKVAAHRLSQVRKDIVLEDGSIVPVGSLKVKVVHTPGHSPDSCCFIVGGRVFTGDCLFVGDCGRVDLPGSSIEAMYDSLFHKVRTMDETLVVCPGHHYGPSPTSTIGREKETNFVLEPGPHTPEAIIRSVPSGLYVTELIGFGVNPVTGDYSRGAAGIWIENGALAYPVEELTIAGNLRNMLRDIEMVGDDLALRSAIASPTLKVGRMTVAGT